MSIIEVGNLGKQYHLGKSQALSLRETLSNSLRRSDQKNDDKFWALRNLNFKVEPGESLALIGKNGAGKSTLLKLLSRITYPTEGSIRIKGRIASLLEVGTGFHPELSGRENIYLNGAILGMRRKEIKNKFDEIVAFSGVEKFLDTPVKHYSSGMYVRLAFSVAAHLEPEILVIDEVLAVGDAEFQKKCLGKMGEVAQSGRTVVFVSHNMTAVRALCQSAIVLSEGQMRFQGNAEEGIKYYLSNLSQEKLQINLRERKDRTGNGSVRVVGISLVNHTIPEAREVRSGDDCSFLFHYEAPESLRGGRITIAFGVLDAYGNLLFRNFNEDAGQQLTEVHETGIFECKIANLPLRAGTYSLGFRVTVNNDEADYIAGANAFQFEVVEGDFYGSGKNSNHAPILVQHMWSHLNAKVNEERL